MPPAEAPITTMSLLVIVALPAAAPDLPTGPRSCVSNVWEGLLLRFPPQMMDPRSPSSSDLREFSRKVREASKRHERQRDPSPGAADPRQADLFCALEELPVA